MLDYYKILNTNSSVSKDEVKKAFKREAFKWHPDRNKSPESTKRMQLINEAYLILHDDAARPRYDKELKRFYGSIRANRYENESVENVGNENSEKDNEYVFEDELLKDWIDKARKQAVNLAKQSLNDLVGMSRAATSAAWEATWGYILFLIVVIILFKLIGLY